MNTTKAHLTLKLVRTMRISESEIKRAFRNRVKEANEDNDMSRIEDFKVARDLLIDYYKHANNSKGADNEPTIRNWKSST